MRRRRFWSVGTNQVTNRAAVNGSALLLSPLFVRLLILQTLRDVTCPQTTLRLDGQRYLKIVNMRYVRNEYVHYIFLQ